MKIHLGCGDKYLPGYVHVDARAAPHVDHVADIRNLSFQADASVDEIYACHVLEHFGRLETRDVLNEWGRVLKKSGTLRLAIPDFEAVVLDYSQSKDLSKYIGLLYGGQDYEYNFHYISFDFNSISKLLEECGFAEIALYNWEDFLPEGFDDFSRAYIPHMDTKNGRLMSLNLTAIKL